PLWAVDAAGRVTALDRSGAAAWSYQVRGEFRHDLVPVDEGRAVAVPDTAGFLHLFASGGSARWRYETESPLAADPGAGLIDGAEVLLVCSGATLHAIDAESGNGLWTAELPAPSMGAPATDGERRSEERRVGQER